MPKENRLAVVVSHPVQHFAPSLRDVSIRFHLKRFSWIPVKMLGEVRAFLWALQLKRNGQALLKRENGRGGQGSGVRIGGHERNGPALTRSFQTTSSLTCSISPEN